MINAEKPELELAVTAFFTSPVNLPEESAGQFVGSIWWEEREGWLCPWRITGERQGYPCGEPKEKVQ